MLPLLTTFRSKFGLNLLKQLRHQESKGSSNTNTLKHPVQKWMLKGIKDDYTNIFTF